MARKDFGKNPADFVATGTWPRATLRTPEGADAKLLSTAKVMQEVAKRLSVEMERLGINTYGLRDKTGIPEPTLRRLLSGVGFGNIVTIIRLEEALKIPLLGEFRNPPGTRRP